MPRPGTPPKTVLQQAMSLFYHAPIGEGIEALNAVNALVVERAKDEHYVPAHAAQDAPAQPKPPQKRRGRPPAAQGAVGSGAGGTGAAPAPPGTAPPSTTPAVDVSVDEARGNPGSLTMPTLGAAPPPDPPVAPAGGRAQTA